MARVSHPVQRNHVGPPPAQCRCTLFAWPGITPHGVNHTRHPPSVRTVLRCIMLQQNVCTGLDHLLGRRMRTACFMLTLELKLIWLTSTTPAPPAVHNCLQQHLLPCVTLSLRPCFHLHRLTHTWPWGWWCRHAPMAAYSALLSTQATEHATAAGRTGSTVKAVPLRVVALLVHDAVVNQRLPGRPEVTAHHTRRSLSRCCCQGPPPPQRRHIALVSTRLRLKTRLQDTTRGTAR